MRGWKWRFTCGVRHFLLLVSNEKTPHFFWACTQISVHFCPDPKGGCVMWSYADLGFKGGERGILLLWVIWYQSLIVFLLMLAGVFLLSLLIEWSFSVLESYWFKCEVTLTAVSGISDALYLLRKKVTHLPCPYWVRSITKISCKIIR